MISNAAIVGMGHTEMSTKPGHEAVSASALASEAISEALHDAGMARSDVDGLLVASSQGIRPDRVGVQLARDDGFGDLRLLEHIEIKGASAVAMVQRAALAINAGLADSVVCVFADAPLQPGGSTGSTYAQSGGNDGVRGLERTNGLLGSVPTYALMAARYLALVGGSEEDLCAVVRTGRAWAADNPQAVQRSALSCAEYHASPMVSTPLRRLDCARPVNGGAAVVISRHRSNSTRAVDILGMSQRHPMRRRRVGAESWTGGDARLALNDALEQAKLTRADISVTELYDPFSITALCLLEDYGLVEPGTAGSRMRNGDMAPGGSLPLNTGGGQLSGFYLQGMTPLIEGIVQLRGEGADRQVAEASVALVTGLGGRMDHHAVLLLGVGNRG